MILLAIIAVLIIYFIPKFLKATKPRGYAEGIAEAQLKTLRIVQNNYPELSKEEQYYKALIKRPGLSEIEVSTIIDTARTSSGKITFRRVVEYLVICKANKIGLQAHKVYGDLLEGINSVISKDL